MLFTHGLSPASTCVVPVPIKKKANNAGVGSGNCSRSRVQRVCKYTPTIPLRDRRAVDKACQPWEQLVFMTVTHAAKHSEAAFLQGAMSVIMHGASDPFQYLGIEMPFKSKQLFHYCEWHKYSVGTHTTNEFFSWGSILEANIFDSKVCHIDYSMNSISQDLKKSRCELTSAPPVSCIIYF